MMKVDKNHYMSLKKKSTSMNILMLNSEYPPLGGGQGNANKYLYEEFKKHDDLKIDVITASVNKNNIETSSLGTIYYLDIGKRGQNLHFQSLKDLIIYSIKSLLLSFKLYNYKRYDLVVAWLGVPSGFIAYVLFLIKRVPYITLLRGSDVPFYEKRWKYLDKFVFSWLSPIIWKNSRCVIANSFKLKELARKFSSNQPIFTIFNGVSTEEFKAKDNYEVNDKIKILSVGRLIERKGFTYLIEALRDIKNVSLTLVGDGPLLEELKHQCRDLDVTFLGNVEHAKLATVYRNSDVFVLPSLNEGMSNTVLEAMACGLPLILTDVGGSLELIKDNGFIVPKQNSEVIQAKIKEFLVNKDLIRTMGMNSRKLAENLSWSRVAQDYLDLFKNI